MILDPALGELVQVDSFDEVDRRVVVDVEEHMLVAVNNVELAGEELQVSKVLRIEAQAYNLEQGGIGLMGLSLGQDEEKVRQCMMVAVCDRRLKYVEMEDHIVVLDDKLLPDELVGGMIVERGSWAAVDDGVQVHKRLHALEEHDMLALEYNEALVHT